MEPDIVILEGASDPNDMAKRVFDTHNKTWREFTNLYSHPHRMRTVASIDPDYIYIFTTGTRVKALNELLIVFNAAQWVPRNVIFGSQESAMSLLGIARDLKEEGTKFHYLGLPDPSSHFTRPINWI